MALQSFLKENPTLECSYIVKENRDSVDGLDVGNTAMIVLKCGNKKHSENLVSDFKSFITLTRI